MARKLETGAILFEQGSEGDEMYVVLDGDLDISVNGKVVETAGPGSMLGEMALIDVQERSATARANNPCTVVPVDKQRFLFLVQQTPFFALEVMHVLADRLRRLHTMVL